MEKKNWAIVDDDAIFHLTTKLLIQKQIHYREIRTFFNGKELIDFITESKNDPEVLPDIILLDLYMPIMDGWDFLEEYLPIRNDLPKKITIYIISSSVDSKDIERAKSISAVKKYIVKPLDRHGLLDIIEELKSE